MMASDNRFAIGKQPCSDFKPKQEWFGSNRHECIYCRLDEVTVSFCENCVRDHHQDGYETCKFERGD